MAHEDSSLSYTFMFNTLSSWDKQEAAWSTSRMNHPTTHYMKYLSPWAVADADGCQSDLTRLSLSQRAFRSSLTELFIQMQQDCSAVTWLKASGGSKTVTDALHHRLVQAHGLPDAHSCWIITDNTFWYLAFYQLFSKIMLINYQYNNQEVLLKHYWTICINNTFWCSNIFSHTGNFDGDSEVMTACGKWSRTGSTQAAMKQSWFPFIL